MKNKWVSDSNKAPIATWVHNPKNDGRAARARKRR